ncbi:MAG TPA: F0F1 ATP synthase subunit gamma [Candidatus Saccharimonadales bacterium]|nr:F0F1 ATP synthase subunit gamma [Candidatus Saccharimonadales bacterium]
MQKLNDLEKEELAMATLVGLTGVFEGIASMRIAQIRNQVLQSTEFFRELWRIYTQLRVDNSFHYGRSKTDIKVINKELYIIITGEGGFSGDIDQRLVDFMKKSYDLSRNDIDIIVIGHHGAMQLAQHGIPFKKYFKLPTKDRDINATPIAEEVRRYRTTQVFYQEYVSLMDQQVRKIAISAAVQELGKNTLKTDEIITDQTYIFEPSTFSVVEHLENTMLQISLAQLILESKLAQYASRFRAMTAAHQKSEESRADIHLAFNRAKRAVKDERLKEIVNGLRKSTVPL